MNELLQEHGCINVFKLPEGLKELMSDISREVLRAQPPKIYPFVANYLSALLMTREHGVLSLRILDELCDCRPTVSQHLMQTGFDHNEAGVIAEVIKEEIDNSKDIAENAGVKEIMILEKVMKRIALDEPATEAVCHITRNAFRDYWYRKRLIEQELKLEGDQSWEVACQRTLELYKKTKPSFEELNRATERIQAAYKGYYLRKQMLQPSKPKRKDRPKQELPGPPIDIASSREIDLGPVIEITIKDDNVDAMFEEDRKEKLGLHYSPMKTITHIEGIPDSQIEQLKSRQTLSRKSVVTTPAPVESQRFPRDKRQSEAVSRRKSRAVSISSQISLTENINKISFAEVPPEMIPPEDIALEVPEELPATQEEKIEVADEASSKPESEAVIPEEVKVEAAAEPDEAAAVPEKVEIETVAEPPEAFIEDASVTPRTDGDGESAPSVPTSAPDTPRTDADADDGGTTTEDEAAPTTTTE